MVGFTPVISVIAMRTASIYIVDRKSDMIIRGGENIYPREIDEVLYQHPDVAAAAAVGVPDPLYGEEVAAFVVLKDGREADEEGLIAHCRARLADFKCPKSVRFVSDIPKGPTGKLLKRELVQVKDDPLANNFRFDIADVFQGKRVRKRASPFGLALFCSPIVICSSSGLAQRDTLRNVA